MAKVIVLSRNNGKRWWTIIDRGELAKWKEDGSLQPGHIIVPLREDEIQTVVVKRELGYRSGIDLEDK